MPVRAGRVRTPAFFVRPLLGKEHTMEALGWLFGLAIAMTCLKAMLPPIIEGIEAEKARREKEQLKKEIAHLPPAERFQIQREYIDVKPHKATPIMDASAVKKG